MQYNVTTFIKLFLYVIRLSYNSLRLDHIIVVKLKKIFCSLFN